MADLDKEELQARIDRLEEKVNDLERRIQGDRTPPEKDNDTVVQAEGTESATASHEEIKGADTENPAWATSNMQVGEQWLNRIGIGLLLIGVAFLFKYSIDQGWLIPPVRSGIGLGIGVLLFVSGLQMKSDIKPLRQILLGGGIAAFYITGFATFQLYTFMPALVIWPFMVVVTLLSLSLSLQQDEAVLSVVGTLGALGTPFMLYTGGGSVISLMIYTVLVLLGTIVVYMRKGWKTLLWSHAVGGALVIFVALINTTYYESSISSMAKWSIQVSALVWMLGAWVLPVVRDMLSANDLYRWPDPSMLLDDGTVDPNMRFRSSSNVHLMSFIVPLLMLVITMGNWDISMDAAGTVSIGLAAMGGLLYMPLNQRDLGKLASTHVLQALSMLTIGFVLLLEGNFLFVVLTIEAVALRFITYQTSDTKISVSSHILFTIVFLWLLNALYYSIGVESSLLNVDSVTQLVALAAGGVLIPKWLRKPDLQQIYQLSTHILFLLWLYQKFSVAGNSHAWITVTWGIYAIVLLIMGFVRQGKGMRLVGMGTIFLVVGKLFLVDLSQLDAIWRILLFMGFGAVFLLLGYYWQSKWSDGDSKAPLSNN